MKRIDRGLVYNGRRYTTTQELTKDNKTGEETRRDSDPGRHGHNGYSDKSFSALRWDKRTATGSRAPILCDLFGGQVSSTKIKMHQLHSHDLGVQFSNRQVSGISFTSFTFGFERKVNRQTTGRQRVDTLLFTSFTSFSKGRVMWASEGGRGRAPLFLSPLRRTGERGERDGFTLPQSGGLSVHFAFSAEVNKPLSFTSVGVAT